MRFQRVILALLCGAWVNLVSLVGVSFAFQVAYPEETQLPKLDELIKTLTKKSATLPPYQFHKQMALYYHAKATAKQGKLQDWQRGIDEVRLAEQAVANRKPVDPGLARNLKGWEGAFLCLKPKFGLNLVETMWITWKGGKLLDEAIAQDAFDYELRIVRAHTYIYFPKSANKTNVVIKDLQFLLSQIDSHGGVGREYLPKLYFGLGYAYRVEGDRAKSQYYLEKVISLYPQSTFARQAKELLSQH